MQDIKAFRKSIRIEIGMLTDTIKRLEYVVMRMRGQRKRHFREQLSSLKRLKDKVMRSILQMRLLGKPLCLTTAKKVKEDVHRIRLGCHTLEAQLR